MRPVVVEYREVGPDGIVFGVAAVSGGSGGDRWPGDGLGDRPGGDAVSFVGPCERLGRRFDAAGRVLGAPVTLRTFPRLLGRLIGCLCGSGEVRK